MCIRDRYNRSALAEKDSLENVIEYFIEQSLITKEKLCEQETIKRKEFDTLVDICLLYTSPSPRDGLLSRMPSSA